MYPCPLINRLQWMSFVKQQMIFNKQLISFPGTEFGTENSYGDHEKAAELRRRLSLDMPARRLSTDFANGKFVCLSVWSNHDMPAKRLSTDFANDKLVCLSVCMIYWSNQDMPARRLSTDFAYGGSVCLSDCLTVCLYDLILICRPEGSQLTSQMVGLSVCLSVWLFVWLTVCLYDLIIICRPEGSTDYANGRSDCLSVCLTVCLTAGQKALN